MICKRQKIKQEQHITTLLPTAAAVTLDRQFWSVIHFLLLKNFNVLQKSVLFGVTK